MTRIRSSLLVLVLAAGLAGCASTTRPLPGTPCCGAACETTCWPRGRIGPFCPGLCEPCEERGCPPPCPGRENPGYTGPRPGRHVS